MITDNDIKRQKIINLERSIGMHILNKSPIEKIQEIRNKIIELKNKIRREENYCYYSAFRTGDMKQTYAKDEGEVPFTLEGLQKIWDAIYKKRKLKKEKRMKLLILEGLYGENKGKKRQWRLKNSPYKVGDIVVLNCHDWKVIKIIEQKKKPITLIMKDYVIPGKFYQSTVWEKPMTKVGGFILHQLPNGDYRACELIKVLMAKKKKKKLDPFIEKRRPKGITYTEFATPIWGLPDANAINKILESLKQKPGTTIQFSSSPMRKNTTYQMEKEYIQKRKLKEFHKRPYFKTTVEEVKGKPRGKENLEKIKFPCFCSYDRGGCRSYGMINKDIEKRFAKYSYRLVKIDEQSGSVNTVWEYDSLAELIKRKHIHILKGKINLYEEE